MIKKIVLMLLLMPLAAAAADGPVCKLDPVLPDNYFPQVKLETSMGDIVVELDTMRAPVAANNFLRYVQEGEYDNTVFHRIEKKFVVQGGGYNDKFEQLTIHDSICNESGNGLKNVTGSIGMARFSDPHSATRQFYFNVGNNDSLDPEASHWGYAVFGTIFSGQEVLQEMSKVKTGYNEYLNAESVPKKNVMLIKATILAED